jgi:hypothetical protein
MAARPRELLESGRSAVETVTGDHSGPVDPLADDADDEAWRAAMG